MNRARKQFGHGKYRTAGPLFAHVMQLNDESTKEEASKLVVDAMKLTGNIREFEKKFKAKE